MQGMAIMQGMAYMEGAHTQESPFAQAVLRAACKTQQAGMGRRYHVGWLEQGLRTHLCEQACNCSRCPSHVLPEPCLSAGYWELPSRHLLTMRQDPSVHQHLADPDRLAPHLHGEAGAEQPVHQLLPRAALPARRDGGEKGVSGLGSLGQGWHRNRGHQKALSVFSGSHAWAFSQLHPSITLPLCLVSPPSSAPSPTPSQDPTCDAGGGACGRG